MDLTTIQIASLCQVSERTVQRWIRDKKLNVQALPNGRYRVTEADIEAVRPPDAVTLQERIEALENALRGLDEALQSLIGRVEALEHKQASQPKVLKPAPAHYTVAPGDLVTARSFAERHQVNRRRMTRLIEAGAFETTPVPHGNDMLHKLTQEQQQAVLTFWQQSNITYRQCTVESCPCHKGG